MLTPQEKEHVLTEVGRWLARERAAGRLPPAGIALEEWRLDLQDREAFSAMPLATQLRRVEWTLIGAFREAESIGDIESAVRAIRALTSRNAAWAENLVEAAYGAARYHVQEYDKKDVPALHDVSRSAVDRETNPDPSITLSRGG